MQNQFDFETLKNQNLESGKEYIKRFFIPLTNGYHIFLNGSNENGYEIIDNPTLKQVYFNRIHVDYYTFYFKEYTGIREPVCILGKPFLFDNKVNLMDKFKHEVKPYNDYDDVIKSKVERVLSFIKEIWANENETTFKYIIGWIAGVMHGKKSEKVLYLKGPQGIGKSTITEFLVNYVMGNLSLVTGSEPLTSKFNIELMGKLLVVFEELENFGVNEWTVIGSRIKRFTTAKQTQYEGKNKDRVKAQDINNYIINSNNGAIKDDEGRRYIILDVSLKRKGDKVFWKSFHKDCMNNEVGEAFYNYLLEYDLSDFDFEDVPETNSKNDAIVKRLDLVAQFLKDNYVLQKKGIKSTVDNLHQEYISFCSNKNARHSHKIDFNKKMAEYGINYRKSNKKNVYNVSCDNLLNIANKNKWIHELDTFKGNDDDVMADLDNGVHNEIDILRQEIETLKEQINTKPKQEPSFEESDAYKLMLKVIGKKTSKDDIIVVKKTSKKIENFNKKTSKPNNTQSVSLTSKRSNEVIKKELILDFDADDDDMFSDDDDCETFSTETEKVNDKITYVDDEVDEFPDEEPFDEGEIDILLL